MGLKENIANEVKEALKARDSLRVSTLRFLLSAVKNKEKDLRRDIEDSEVETVAQAQVKQRRDSIEQFVNGGREDLADKERAELEILKAFIPEEMGADEIRVIVSEAKTSTGATSMQDMGKLMGAVMPKVKGKADGKLVNAIVKELLS